MLRKFFPGMMLVLLPVWVLAQDQADSARLDTFDFNLKNFTGKGEFTFVTKKSKATEMVYQLSLPKGVWEYFDNNEAIRIRGAYRVRSEVSLKTGIWEYFDSEGELLMTESYEGSYKLTFLKPFVLRTEDGYEVIQYNESEELVATHVVKPLSAEVQSAIYKEENPGRSTKQYNFYDSLVSWDKQNPNSWLIAKPWTKIPDASLNLVDNGGFETDDGKLKYTGMAIGNHINGWKSAAGTPDYFNSRRFNAFEGHAAVGCRFFTRGVADIEFIATQLKETLEKDHWYCLSMNVRLQEDCQFGVNALGALLSDRIPEPLALIDGLIKPVIRHNGGSVLTYKTQWMQLGCHYQAKGNEEYLVLGSFANADSMGYEVLKGNKPEAYYFFDDIRFYEVPDAASCPCSLGKKESPPVQEVKKKVFVIRNIFFENDRSELLPESYISLDSLAQVLELKEYKKIEIGGHTSNTGSRARNIELSRKRAEAVKKYLVDQGLPPGLFVCKGYGPDQPVADNETDEGQAENRRVEFTILEE